MYYFGKEGRFGLQPCHVCKGTGVAPPSSKYAEHHRAQARTAEIQKQGRRRVLNVSEIDCNRIDDSRDVADDILRSAFALGFALGDR